jgi:hypothetical protein
MKRAILGLSLLVLSQADGALANTVYDCSAGENQSKQTTIEIVLSRQWKDRTEEVRQSFRAVDDSVKVRVKIFPFLNPPENIGIGKCVSAEEARWAIQKTLNYYGKIEQLIRQDILPHHWIKIGSTDLPELTWVSVSSEDLARLADPALSTAQFHELYRRLATPKVKKLPFGMGNENLEKDPSRKDD